MRGSGWRRLGIFWAALGLVVVAGGATLQILGPPAPAARMAAARPMPPAAVKPPPTQPATQPPTQPATQPAAPALAASAQSLASPGRDTPGPIPDPDPGLLEPAKAGGGAMLPRVDGGGRGPMQAYAGGFDRTTRRPRIGLILAGIGLNEAESLNAIRMLPAGITLAVSPYASRLVAQLDAARIGGHEYLLSLPMEPQGYPLNNAGDHALMSGVEPVQNADRLDWALSRFAGYAGVTSALGILHGDRFAGAPDLMAPVVKDLAARGLFYVDARPGAGRTAGIWSADVDVVVDDPATRADIDARLAQLEALARRNGAALGLAGAPRPMTVDRLATWSNGLAEKGLILAPVSALVQFRPTSASTSAATAAPDSSSTATPAQAKASE